MFYPEIKGKWINVDRWPNRDCRDKAYAIFSKLAEFDPESAGIIPGEFSEIPALRFDDDAQELFDEWRCQHINCLRAGENVSCPAFESHLAKYPSLMPSLALIFHLADWASQQSEYAPNIPIKPVTLEATRLAATWCEFLNLHAQKVYAGAIRPDIQSAHALAANIKNGKIKDRMSMRDIYRAQWGNLRTKTALYEATAILDECKWVQVEKVETERKPSEILRINPKVEVKS